MLITDEHDIRQAILQSGFQAHAQNCLDRVLARIAELEAVLDRMRRDGCGNASPIHPGSSEFENCREKFPGEPDEWCWSCQAHEALSS